MIKAQVHHAHTSAPSAYVRLGMMFLWCINTAAVVSLVMSFFSRLRGNVTGSSRSKTRTIVGLDLGVFGGQLVLGARRVVGILLGLYVRPDRIFHDEACSWCPLRG